jgi:hypothetical protein
MAEVTVLPMNDAQKTAADQARSDHNLTLWRQNEMTDPAHTRPVRIGRDMTAIDTYYQIKRATETFGPMGVGWGWNLEEETIHAQTSTGAPIAFAKCKVTLWYIDPDTSERVLCGAVIGVNQLVSAKGHPDDEAYKKATSDAITKSLSYLGFSADIFMGLYDDAKYVARLKTEFSARAAETKNKLPEIMVKAVEGLPKITDLLELDASWKVLKADLRKLTPSQLDYMKARYAMRKRELAPEEPEPPADPDPGQQGSGAAGGYPYDNA